MIQDRIKSIGYALKGIRLFFRREPNAIIHLIISILVIAAGFFFSVNITEWCFLILAITLVLSAEGMNTAIEYLTDLVSPEYHELAGKTKDVAAGAVLISAIGAAIVGIIIFLPKVIDFFSP